MNPAALAGLRIGLLTASASRAGGGVFEAVVAQARLIAALGGTPLVFALADAHSAADQPRWEGIAVSHSPVLGPRAIGFAPILPHALLGAGMDLLHLHGIWQYRSRAATLWTKATGRPLLISPHGMMEAWITARGRAKKAVARLGYERAAWRSASAFHALTEAEAASIRHETGRIDCEVIANPAPAVGPPRHAAEPREFLYLGRIHPKKNLTGLIDGWRLAVQAGLAPGARLTIAGWGDAADIVALERAVAAAGAQVRYLGPVFGAEKAALLADAHYVVLPSFSEGLPMAILEAWAAGSPTIMTAACNLPQGFATGAALECATAPVDIARRLIEASRQSPAEWRERSHAARQLAAGDFAPELIAQQWARTYRGLIDAASVANPPT